MPEPKAGNHIEGQVGDDASIVAIGANITQNVYIGAEPAPPAFDPAAVEARYRAQVVKHYNRMTLTGLPERDPGLNELPLAQIFVRLKVELSQSIEQLISNFEKLSPPPQELLAWSTGSGKTEPAFRMLERFRQLEEEARQPQRITFSVAEALDRYRRLVILGGPGSGKTTLTRWLAVHFANRKQANAENLGERFAADRLPVLLELRRFADHLTAASRPGVAPKLAESIATYIHEHAYYADAPAAFVQQALADGRCLLLFDGLDEIADLGVRRTLSDAIQALWQHPDQHYRDNLVIVTSRPHGYRDVELGGAFQRCEVKEFSPEDVQYFIRAWYATAYGDAEQSEAQDLIDAVQANERVGDLARNPLLCTIIAIVYRNNRVLPNRRVELYLKCCEALLDTWERNKAIKDSGLIGGYDWHTKLELLAPVAYWLHGQAERLAAPEAEFVKQLAAVLRRRKLGDPAQAEQEARHFIQVIRDRSGLLQGRGDGSLEFMHRTFQEYLAARHIAAKPDPDYIDLVMTDLHIVWWHEVHLLVIGYLGTNSATAEKASKLLITILNCYRPPFSILAPILPMSAYLAWQFVSLAEKIKRGYFFLIPHMFLSGIFFSSTILLNYLARLLPSLQLPQRLAWILNREIELAARGYLDCAPLGVAYEVSEYLQVRIKEIVLMWVGSQDYFSLIPFAVAILRRLSGHLDLSSLVDELLQMTSSEFWLIRAKSILMLGIICDADFSVEILKERLRDPSAAVRLGIITILSQNSAHDPVVLEALINATDDKEREVQRAAIEALGFSDAPPQVIMLLLRMLDNSERSLRSIAVDSLGKIGRGDSAVQQALLRSLKDKDSSVRVAAINAIVNIGEIETLVVVDSLFLALRDDDHYVRHNAARVLGYMGRVSPQVVDALLQLLTSAEGPTRYAAIDAVEVIDQVDRRIEKALISALHDTDWFTRLAAARVSNRVNSVRGEVAQLLQDALATPDQAVRVIALATIEGMEQPPASVKGQVVSALDDPDWLIRLAAVRALRKLGQTNWEQICRLLQSRGLPDWFFSLVAPFMFLVQRAYLEEAATSMRDLNSQDWFVYSLAIRQFTQKGQSTLARFKLAAVIKDPIRIEIIRTLGEAEIENEKQYYQLLVVLNRYLHYDNADVRQVALEAIRSLVRGRTLPGYKWSPLRQRMASKRRFFAVLHWLVLLVGSVMAAWALAYLDGESLLMRVLLVLGGLIGIGAGLAQIVGRPLRNPWDGEAAYWAGSLSVLDISFCGAVLARPQRVSNPVACDSATVRNVPPPLSAMPFVEPGYLAHPVDGVDCIYRSQETGREMLLDS